MDQFHGIIEVTRIANTGLNAAKIGTITLRFVRYPGCQQLSVWLPEFGGHVYGQFRWLDRLTGELRAAGQVRDKLSGSVLLTWDTVPMAPGEYLLEIEREDGVCHIAELKKWAADELLPADQIVEMPLVTADHPSLWRPPGTLDPSQVEHDTDSASSAGAWPIHRDGWGNIIPNEDALLREQAALDLGAIFARLAAPQEDEPRVEYQQSGRSGNIIYRQGDKQIKFYYEFGGGPCQLFIVIPSASDWERETGMPLLERRRILLTVAQAVRHDKAPSWRFEILDTEINFY